MDKHGDFFPENPQNIDELIDALAQRAAAAQRMRNSMTQEQRDELDALAAAGLRQPRADAVALAARRQPACAAARARTGAARRSSAASRGSASATAPACCRTSPTSTTSPSSSRSPTAAPGWTTSTSTSWRASSATRRPSTPGSSRELERALHETGYLKRGSDGQLKLSPKAMRQLGKALLQGRRQPDVRTPGPARHAPRRRRRGADRRDPRVDVRRHRAVGRHRDDHQRASCGRPATARTRWRA